jgi:hypothetical protein
VECDQGKKGHFAAYGKLTPALKNPSPAASVLTQWVTLPPELRRI